MNSQSQSPPVVKNNSWWKGIVAGVLLTLLVVGIAVWLTTGVGLLRLLETFRDGNALIHIDQPTVVRQIAQERLDTSARARHDELPVYER